MAEKKQDTEPLNKAAPGEPQAKKNRLGKGLSALLGEYLPEGGAASSHIRMVPVARITPNPFQPRREFAPEQLAELEASIRENGLLQPLVVRAATDVSPAGAEWELVAGERRWRAVRRLGWTEVPVVAKEIDDRAMLVLAIVENVQRADLSPLEEANGYRQLIEEFGFTQREVAESVGRERSTVANLLRLLQLPASVQRLVGEGRISMGHARAILGMPDERQMAELARQAAEQGLSVRAVEERVRGRRSPAESSSAPAATDSGGEPHVRHLEAELQRALGTAVRIRVTRGESGRIEIPFYNPGDFERVMELLLGSEATSI
jgi:ParB family chromosome partitioning protein